MEETIQIKNGVAMFVVNLKYLANERTKYNMEVCKRTSITLLKIFSHNAIYIIFFLSYRHFKAFLFRYITV